MTSKQQTPKPEVPKTELRSRIGSLFSKLDRNRYKVVIFLVVMAVVVAAVFQAAVLIQRSQQKQQALREYSKKAEESAQAEQTKTLREARNHQIAHEQFKDVTDEEFQKPSCERLENRKAITITNDACDYKVRAVGASTMAVVLLYEKHSDTGKFIKKNPDQIRSIYYLNTYLEQQAKRYDIDDVKVKMSVFGPYQLTESTDGLYYRDKGSEILKIYEETSTKNNVPEQKYDMVHYVELDHHRGGVAFRSSHRAFTQGKNVPVFIHETLHLFGASDKYHNNDCATIGTKDPFDRYDKTKPGRDIMCSSYSLRHSNINDITAREIGWPN